MHQDEENGDGGDDYLVPHHVAKCVDRAVNEARAIVGRYDVNTFGQCWLQLLDLFFNAFGYGEGVTAVSHQHGSAGHFVAAFLKDASAELSAELHGGHVLDEDGRAVRLFDDRVFDVVFVPDPADAADDIFGVVLLDDAATCRHVALANGGKDPTKRDAIGAQVLRPNIDLIFERCSAHYRDVGHTCRGIQLRRDVKLVECPKPAGINRMLGSRFNGIPVDLA